MQTLQHTATNSHIQPNHNAQSESPSNDSKSKLKSKLTITTAQHTLPPWDINQDGKTDIGDIVIVAAAYGSTPECPDWNSLTDINIDGIVDLRDVIMVAIHYGEQYT